MITILFVICSYSFVKDLLVVTFVLIMLFLTLRIFYLIYKKVKQIVLTCLQKVNFLYFTETHRPHLPLRTPLVVSI